MRRLGPSSRQTSAQLGPLGSKLGPNLGPTGGFGRKLRLRFMHMWSKSGPTWRSLGQFSGSFGTSWAQTLPNTEPPSSPTKKREMPVKTHVFGIPRWSAMSPLWVCVPTWAEVAHKRVQLKLRHVGPNLAPVRAKWVLMTRTDFATIWEMQIVIWPTADFETFPPSWS